MNEYINEPIVEPADALPTVTLADLPERLQRAAENSPPIRRNEPDQAAVEILQKAFADLGFPMPKSAKPNGRFDGVFGAETEATVRKFQTQHGLAADGVVGRNTLHRLDATRFELHVDRSFAEYAWLFLAEAARELNG